MYVQSENWKIKKEFLSIILEHGYSVLQVIHAYEKACGKELPYVIDPRRPGDIAQCYCDPTKAANELGWKADLGIEEMCRDSWKWQSANPDGYNQN